MAERNDVFIGYACQDDYFSTPEICNRPVFKWDDKGILRFNRTVYKDSNNAENQMEGCFKVVITL